MIELKDLLEENETLVTFHLCNEYWSRNAITVKGNDDISGALEMTLHRILEAGGTENDVKRIMGAEIPTEDELKELEEFDEFSWIDLGYVLPGLIDLWEEREPVLIPDFTFHVLRHTFCTRMAEDGMDVKVLQEIMGHSNIAVTMQVYNHVSDDRAINEMNKIQNVIGL